MKNKLRCFAPFLLASVAVFSSIAHAGIGDRFPSERKVVNDPVTGTPLTFLTSTPAGDSKIYPTHPQWTADGQWLIFRSNRAQNQAFAVNETSGDIVQVTDSGYSGMLVVARKSMRLFFLRPIGERVDGATPGNAVPRPAELVAIDLARVFADSAAKKMKAARKYEKVFGTIPAEMNGGDLSLDANEEVAYFRLGKEAAARHMAANSKLEPNFGPRNMGAGPSGIASMNLQSGAIKVVVAVPFQVGHIQANPFITGELMFCWETGGKAPQRMWTVMADGSGLRALFPESNFDWVTHEVFVTKDEVAFAILGHRAVGTNDAWGVAATREHPTGLGIVNLRTREVFIEGQTRTGSGLWHVHASPDGRWAVGDDFARNLWLIDRRTGEKLLLSTGHKTTARDHVHPTFSADSTRVEIQSAMLSEDNQSMNICIVPIPEAWMRRSYDSRTAPPR